MVSIRLLICLYVLVDIYWNPFHLLENVTGRHNPLKRARKKMTYIYTEKKPSGISHAHFQLQDMAICSKKKQIKTLAVSLCNTPFELHKR